MKFHYFLDCSVGYANLLFEHGKFSHNFTIEYCLEDDIEKLLNGILALTEYKQETNKFCHDVADAYINDNTFEWKISVGSIDDTFIFSKTNKKSLNLKIIEDDEESKCIFNGGINLIELVDCIIVSCEKMLNRYGIIGYYLNFWNEFPMTSFLMLKDYRNRKIKFDSFKEEFNNKEEEMYRSNIKDELNYINNAKDIK
jgi:hypothetical protein